MHSLLKLLKCLDIPYERVGAFKSDRFDAIVPVFNPAQNCLIFINRPDDKTFDILRNRRNSIVLLEYNWGMTNSDILKDLELSIFLVNNPRLVFCRLMHKLHANDEIFFNGIHPTAEIDPDAKIHDSVKIGAHCIIGKCEIGEKTRIHASTIIKDNVIIGKNVIIREFCLVGGCGFGFVRFQDSHLERIPHIGSVFIEDNVELFPYTNVDRGTLEETRIKSGTKVDHYCHIGHNSLLGENTIITAGTVFCGGSRIGDRSWAGVGSIVKEDVSVGDDAVIGLGAVVNRNVRDKEIVVGVPAKPIKEK